ncbi:MAG TPA: OB-fold nucleic acid binding domain-containing protein, partial [Blastocatellia bacterium]|nr:OB-fold nucleic acid binding domain-containing protein [Blastocatellia bacterium]
FAYAYLAYHTAYLKAHYPTHFYAAVLSNEIDNTDKVAKYIAEMRSRGYELLPPEINSSHEGFTSVNGAVRYGLAAIKGVGSSAVQAIVSARESGGPFKSLFDLAERVDTRTANKRVFESLIKAGAMDSLAPKGATQRSAMLSVLERAFDLGAKSQRDKATGQGGLFELASVPMAEPELPDVKPWTRTEQLSYEKEAMGFYASGHPLEDYVTSLEGLANATTSNLTERASNEVVAIGGIILDLGIRTTKKGDRFALFRLEDQFGSVKVVCWPEQFNRYKDRLIAEAAVLVKGRLEIPDEGAPSLIVNEVQPLEGARAMAARAVVITFHEEQVNHDKLNAL